MTTPELKIAIISEMVTTMTLYKEEFYRKLKTGVTFSIQDEITYNYEEAGKLASKIKCARNETLKLNNQKQLAQVFIEKNSNIVDTFVGNEMYIKSQNIPQNQLYFNELLNGVTLEEQEQTISTHIQNYIHYQTVANDFLKCMVISK